MRDRNLRRWQTLVRERAKADWRELSLEVVDELACHLADLHASALERGESDADADRIALDALKSASFLELSKRPRARRSPVGYVQDFRLALRQLNATPVVSFVAVLSLALGIGANTAIFSLVDSLVLRTLPVNEPGRLAIVTDTANRSATTYRIWREIDERQLFERAFAWSDMRFNLSERGETDLVDGIWASAGIFDAMGVTPVVGRGFVASDDRRGGGPDGPVAVISYAFWQRRFGGAPDAIGRRVTVERIPFTIVGILPPEFFGPEVGRRLDLVVPIGAEPLVRTDRSALDDSWWWWLTIMVRLKPGQSLERATASLRAVQPAIRAATLPPDTAAFAAGTYLKEAYVVVGAATGSSDLRRRYERPLMTLLIVVGLVLLIACANIANLLLARATARRHEMSVRLALGASRWRLARQLLVESLVLAASGAALGLLVARWGSELLVQQLSTAASTVVLDLSLDGRVLGFTAAVTTITAVLFGIAPAFRSSRAAPIDAIKESGRGTVGERRISMAAALVVGQVALSLVLVVAAGLFVRTFSKLAALPLGFDRDRVLLVRVDMQRAPIDPGQRVPIIEQALDAVRAVPGVERAAFSLITPIGGGGWNGSFEVSDGVPLTDRQRRVYRNMVSPGWFATFGTPLLAGRDFARTDRTGAPTVAVVNESFARRFLHGANPLGRIAKPVNGLGAGRPIQIVGVVGDAAYESIRSDPPPTIYTSGLQPELGPPAASFDLHVRAARGSPALLARSVAAAINGVHPDLALTFRTLSDRVDAALTQERIVAMLSGFFGALALLLAGLGMYGVTSYAVTRRRTELGIRMALGAPPSGVVRMVLARVALLVGAGVLIGAGISAWASTLVATLLYGLEPRDPATLAGSAVALALVGAAASWLPAHRASRIDPAEVLRES